MPQWILDIDWVTLGTQVFGWLSLIVGYILWFRKNIANLAQLKSEASNFDGFLKYFKAILRNNNNLINEISNLKIEIYEMKRDIKRAVKEAVEDVLHK